MPIAFQHSALLTRVFSASCAHKSKEIEAAMHWCSEVLKVGQMIAAAYFTITHRSIKSMRARRSCSPSVDSRQDDCNHNGRQSEIPPLNIRFWSRRCSNSRKLRNMRLEWRRYIDACISTTIFWQEHSRVGSRAGLVNFDLARCFRL